MTAESVTLVQYDGAPELEEANVHRGTPFEHESTAPQEAWSASATGEVWVAAETVIASTLLDIDEE